MVIYQTDKTKLEVLSEKNCVKATVEGFVKEDAYREMMTTFAEYAQENPNIVSLVSDTRKGQIVSTQVQKWLIEDYIPNFILKHTNLKNFAFIKSDSIFREAFNTNLKRLFKKQVNVDLFTTEEEAFEWLDGLEK